MSICSFFFVHVNPLLIYFSKSSISIKFHILGFGFWVEQIVGFNICPLKQFFFIKKVSLANVDTVAY